VKMAFFFFLVVRVYVMREYEVILLQQWNEKRKTLWLLFFF